MRTSVILDNMSSFGTLVELLAYIERTFGEPDQERTSHIAATCTQDVTGYDGRGINSQF